MHHGTHRVLRQGRGADLGRGLLVGAPAGDVEGVVRRQASQRRGVGREGGEEGLWPYLETKTILLDGAPERL